MATKDPIKERQQKGMEMEYLGPERISNFGSEVEDQPEEAVWVSAVTSSAGTVLPPDRRCCLFKRAISPRRS
jgi:hypothetical protein